MGERVYVDEELKELIPIFLTNRKKDLKELRDLIAESDLAGIKQLGHNLKGTGGGYGFDKITELGRQLEEAAAEGKEEKIKALREELAVYLEEVEIIYQ